MDVGNQTSVTVVGFSGACAALLFWIIGFFAPEFMMAAPTGAEAALTTVIVGLLGYFLPFDGTPSGK